MPLARSGTCMPVCLVQSVEMSSQVRHNGVHVQAPTSRGRFLRFLPICSCPVQEPLQENHCHATSAFLHVSCTYNILVLPCLQDPHSTIPVMHLSTFPRGSRWYQDCVLPCVQVQLQEDPGKAPYVLWCMKHIVRLCFAPRAGTTTRRSWQCSNDKQRSRPPSWQRLTRRSRCWARRATRRAWAAPTPSASTPRRVTKRPETPEGG
jgi:hypothetical protein